MADIQWIARPKRVVLRPPAKRAEVNEARMRRILQMVILLFNDRKTISEISEYFEMSIRTTYRYLKLIDSLNIPIDKDFENKYFIQNYNCPLCGGVHTTNNHHE